MTVLPDQVDPDFKIRRRNSSQVWSKFSEETTLHACKNIKHAKRKSERVWWSLVLFGLVFGLVYTFADHLICLLKFRTTTRSSVEYVTSLDFPTITFCNANAFNKSKLSNPNIAKFLTAYSPILSHLIPKDIPIDGSWMNESVDEMYWNVSFKKEEQIALALLENKKLDMEMFEEVQGSAGVCFRFNSEKLIQQHGMQRTMSAGPLGSLNLVLNIHQDDYLAGPYTHAGMQIYINHQSHTQNHYDPSIQLLPGTTAFVAMTKTQYKLLGYPYTSFGSDYCLDTEEAGFRNPLQFHSTYSWGACLLECFSRLSVNNCGCRTCVDPDAYKVPNCTFHQYSTCTYKYYNQVFINLTSQQMLCNCQKPCSFYVYDTKLSQGAFPSTAAADYMVDNGFVNSTEYARRNLINVQIFYEQLVVNKVEHEAEYTFRSVISSVGGEMGFFLGCSVVTLYEIVQASFLSLHALVSRRKGRNTVTVVREVAKT